MAIGNRQKPTRNTILIDRIAHICHNIQLFSHLHALNYVNSMKDIIKVKSRGKGAFAFENDVKVLKGTTCTLLRNKANVHGEGLASF